MTSVQVNFCVEANSLAAGFTVSAGVTVLIASFKGVAAGTTEATVLTGAGNGAGLEDLGNSCPFNLCNGSSGDFSGLKEEMILPVA